VHHDDPEVALAKIDAILCSESQGNNTIAMAIATAAMSEIFAATCDGIVSRLENQQEEEDLTNEILLCGVQ